MFSYVIAKTGQRILEDRRERGLYLLDSPDTREREILKFQPKDKFHLYESSNSSRVYTYDDYKFITAKDSCPFTTNFTKKDFNPNNEFFDNIFSVPRESILNLTSNSKFVSSINYTKLMKTDTLEKGFENTLFGLYNNFMIKLIVKTQDGVAIQLKFLTGVPNGNTYLIINSFNELLATEDIIVLAPEYNLKKDKSEKEYNDVIDPNNQFFLISNAMVASVGDPRWTIHQLAFFAENDSRLETAITEYADKKASYDQIKSLMTLDNIFNNILCRNSVRVDPYADFGLLSSFDDFNCLI